MTNSVSKRNQSIDAIKGVGILCITLLHFEEGIFPSWLNTWIGLFMVNTFYFTSGWLMSLKSNVPTPKELLKKRIRQLGIPYVYFSVIILVFNFFWWLLGLMSLRNFLRDAYKAIAFCGIGTLWFLPALFGSECLFCFMRHKKRHNIVAILLIILSITVCNIYNQHWLPLRDLDDCHRVLDAPLRPFIRSLQGWPIICIGYYTGKYLAAKLDRMTTLHLIGLGVIFIVISLALLCPQLPSMSFLGQWLSNTLPELGLLCFFMAYKYSYIENFFTYWGKNSLILMCTHYSITEEVLKTIDRHILGFQEFSGLRTLVYFAITIAITYPLIWIINKKCNFILGRNKRKAA